jgi:hypothetical protein
MTKQQGIALGIILAGVVLVNLAKEKKSSPKPANAERSSPPRQSEVATEA